MTTRRRLAALLVAVTALPLVLGANPASGTPLDIWLDVTGGPGETMTGSLYMGTQSVVMRGRALSATDVGKLYWAGNEVCVVVSSPCTGPQGPRGQVVATTCATGKAITAVNADGTSVCNAFAYFDGTFYRVPGNALVDGSIVYMRAAGPDGYQTIYFYEDGSRSGERFEWDDVQDRFDISDDLYVEGTVATTGNILEFNHNGPDRDQNIFFYEDGKTNKERLAWDDANDRFFASTNTHVDGQVEAFTLRTTIGSVYVNDDGPDATSEVYFYEDGSRTGEAVRWDNSLDQFSLTDDVRVEGDLKVDGATLTFHGNDFKVNADGPDGTSSVYFFEDGIATGERVFWEDANDRFSVSDELLVDGPIATTANEIRINTDGPDGDAFLYFYDGGSNLREGLVWEDGNHRFRISDDAIFEGILEVTGNQIRINADGPDGESSLLFWDAGFSIAEGLVWEDTNHRFRISDDLYVEGELTTLDAITTSSRRFKTNVAPIEDALAKAIALEGVSYDRAPDGRRDIGFIAEDVAAVVPEVVRWEPNGIDAVGLDYAKLTALLAEALEEQEATIRALEERIAALEAR